MGCGVCVVESLPFLPGTLATTVTLVSFVFHACTVSAFSAPSRRHLHNDEHEVRTLLFLARLAGAAS